MMGILSKLLVKQNVGCNGEGVFFESKSLMLFMFALQPKGNWIYYVSF